MQLYCVIKCLIQIHIIFYNTCEYHFLLVNIIKSIYDTCLFMFYNEDTLNIIIYIKDGIKRRRIIWIISLFYNLMSYIVCVLKWILLQ